MLSLGRAYRWEQKMNKDDVFVGRIREDINLKNVFHLWIVSDNLRKGAATNTVQIADYLIDNNLIF